MAASEAGRLATLAQSLRQQHRFTEAADAARRAVAADARHAPGWFNLGAALAALGSVGDAETAYRQALEFNPMYAEAWSNLGGLLGRAGKYSDEIACYRKSIEANPGLAPVWSNLSNALCHAGRYAEAEEASRRAITLDPGFPPAWVNLSRALLERGRTDEALSACRRATDLAPGVAEAWGGLGNVLVKRRDFAAAAQAYERATMLVPGDAALHANLGVTLRRLGDETAGVSHLRRALDLDPRNAFASWSLSTSLLERGDFDEGWRHYESRWLRAEAPKPRFARKGELPGKGSLLVWGEQGVGDEILFARLAAEAAADGRAVTLEADARLAPLLERSFPHLQIVKRRVPPLVSEDDFDCAVPAGSLGGWLRPSWSAFPNHSGYLRADTSRVGQYRRTLQKDGGSLVVGLSWRSSNPEVANEKSAPLMEWLPLLQLDEITFVSLQYGPVEEECRAVEQRLGRPILQFRDLDVTNDLDGLAALVSACDLVITTSNVTAHLTGGLGRPGWVLLPRRIGRLWYWFHDRPDSPWYPSLRLMPQVRDGEWMEVLQSAADSLREHLHIQS